MPLACEKMQCDDAAVAAYAHDQLSQIGSGGIFPPIVDCRRMSGIACNGQYVHVHEHDNTT